MNIFLVIESKKNNGIKKYDDNRIIIVNVRYETYIINKKTMEATKKIFMIVNIRLILF